MRVSVLNLRRSSLARHGLAALTRLWREDDGAILSSELLLVSTLLVIGLVSGIEATRTAILTEMGDVSAALGTMNQSFSIGGTTSLAGASTAGSEFIDALDQGDPDQQFGKFAGQSFSNCVVVCTTAIGEDGFQSGRVR